MKTIEELRAMTLTELCYYLNVTLLPPIERKAEENEYVYWDDVVDLSAVLLRIIDEVDTVLLNAILPSNVTERPEGNSSVVVLQFLNEAIRDARKSLGKVSDFTYTLTQAAEKSGF